MGKGGGGDGRRGEGGMVREGREYRGGKGSWWGRGGVEGVHVSITEPVLTSSSIKSNSRAHRYIWVWKSV